MSQPLCSSLRLSSAKPSAPVIMDGKKIAEEDDDDDDEQFLVEEAVPPPSGAPEVEVVSDLNSNFFIEKSKQGVVTIFSVILIYYRNLPKN